MNRKVAWTILANLGFIGMAGRADFQHYTWWSQATFTTYALAAVVGLDTVYFFFFVAMQIQVMASVLLMSYADCNVFESAYNSMWSIEYIGGDFYLHWLPAIVALGLAPYDKLVIDSDHIIIQIWTSYALLLSWSYFNNPWDVYGCNLPGSMVIFVPWLVAALTTSAVFAILWYIQ